MQDFVSVNPPSLTEVVKKKHKRVQMKTAINAISFVAGIVAMFCFGCGLLTGWIIWG